MTYKLFIDDERYPADDISNWMIVRSSGDAIGAVQNRGVPSFISFDHDLGGADTARIFIAWLTNALIDGSATLPGDFHFTVHSQNPVGAEWIRGTMESLIHHFG
jgi:hypothetical protein